jgi:ketosteroid isomerase-like protein
MRLALALLLTGLSSVSLARSPPRTAAEVALTRLDMQQKAMVARADVDALAALSAPDLTINAPTGRVLTRAQFLAMMRDGRIGAEDFDRTIESVTVSGDTGVVMGREVFTPTPQSELGRTYGAVPLDRRYTNVYRRERGKWRWLARHANVVMRKVADVGS